MGNTPKNNPLNEDLVEVRKPKVHSRHKKHKKKVYDGTG